MKSEVKTREDAKDILAVDSGLSAPRASDDSEALHTRTQTYTTHLHFDRMIGAGATRATTESRLLRFGSLQEGTF